MSLAILFHFFYAQHVSDINTSIIRSLRLFYCNTTLVVCSCFDVLEFRCGCVGVVSVYEAEACYTDTTPTQPHRNSNTHRNKNTRPMWWYNRKVAGPDDGCINVRNMFSIDAVVDAVSRGLSVYRERQEPKAPTFVPYSSVPQPVGTLKMDRGRHAAPKIMTSTDDKSSFTLCNCCYVAEIY